MQSPVSRARETPLNPHGLHNINGCDAEEGGKTQVPSRPCGAGGRGPPHLEFGMHLHVGLLQKKKLEPNDVVAPGGLVIFPGL